MKPLQAQVAEWIAAHPTAEMKPEDIAREAFLAGAEVSAEQMEQWEKARADAAEVMGEILDGNLYRAQRKARWWLNLHQCSGPTQEVSMATKKANEMDAR